MARSRTLLSHIWNPCVVVELWNFEMEVFMRCLQAVLALHRMNQSHKPWLILTECLHSPL